MRDIDKLKNLFRNVMTVMDSVGEAPNSIELYANAFNPNMTLEFRRVDGNNLTIEVSWDPANIGIIEESEGPIATQLDLANRFLATFPGEVKDED